MDNGLQNIGGYTIHTVTYVNGSASAYDISNGLSYAQQTPVFFLIKNTLGDNEANATLKYYPNGNNITIFDTLGSNYSPIQQGVWKKDTWGLFFCAGNSTVQLRSIFYDSVDIDDIKNNIINILGIENLPYYIVSSVSDDGKRITYNIDDYTILDGNSFYLKVPYYETSTDRKVTLKQNNIYIKQSSNYVTESQVNGHLLKLRYNNGIFEVLEIYDDDKLIPSFSALSELIDEKIVDLSELDLIDSTHSMASTSNWTGTSTRLTSLTKGTRILYRITYLPTARSQGATLSIRFTNNTSSSSIPIIFSNGTQLYGKWFISSIAKNDVLLLEYDGTNWVLLDFFAIGERPNVARTGSYNDLSDKPSIPTIVDNLTTNDATKVLSAKQGKVLNDLIGDAITYINE